MLELTSSRACGYRWRTGASLRSFPSARMGRSAQAVCVESPFDPGMQGASLVISVDDVIAVVNPEDSTHLN